MDKQVPEHLLIEAYNAIMDVYDYESSHCCYCSYRISDELLDHNPECILLKARQFNADLMKAHIEEIENTAADKEDRNRFYKDHYYDGV